MFRYDHFLTSNFPCVTRSYSTTTKKILATHPNTINTPGSLAESLGESRSCKILILQNQNGKAQFSRNGGIKLTWVHSCWAFFKGQGWVEGFAKKKRRDSTAWFSFDGLMERSIWARKHSLLNRRYVIQSMISKKKPRFYFCTAKIVIDASKLAMFWIMLQKYSYQLLLNKTDLPKIVLKTTCNNLTQETKKLKRTFIFQASLFVGSPW